MKVRCNEKVDWITQYWHGPFSYLEGPLLGESTLSTDWSLRERDERSAIITCHHFTFSYWTDTVECSYSDLVRNRGLSVWQAGQYCVLYCVSTVWGSICKYAVRVRHQLETSWAGFIHCVTAEMIWCDQESDLDTGDTPHYDVQRRGGHLLLLGSLRHLQPG